MLARNYMLLAAHVQEHLKEQYQMELNRWRNLVGMLTFPLPPPICRALSRVEKTFLKPFNNQNLDQNRQILMDSSYLHVLSDPN